MDINLVRQTASARTLVVAVDTVKESVERIQIHIIPSVIVNLECNVQDFGRIGIEKVVNALHGRLNLSSSHMTNTVTELVPSTAVAHVHVESSVASIQGALQSELVIGKEWKAALEGCHGVGEEHLVDSEVADIVESIATLAG